MVPLPASLPFHKVDGGATSLLLQYNNGGVVFFLSEVERMSDRHSYDSSAANSSLMTLEPRLRCSPMTVLRLLRSLMTLKREG